MSLAKDSPLISICIPTYNGYPYISKLIDELLNSPRSDFEVVVSDDCSADQTWGYLQSIGEKDARLKCSRNSSNQGMDKNFTRSVALARGQYVWLCGQDDMIFHQGIDAVIEQLVVRPEIDFVYLNHKKIQEGTVDQVNNPNISVDHVYGYGLEEFLQHHHSELPTFLPKYILRKALWDSVEVGRYFGTCYCQVGVFLESSQHMQWCHLGGNYVLGLMPKNGWQINPHAYTRINLGFFLMLNRVSEKCKWIDWNIIALQYRLHLKQLIYSIILMRCFNLPIERAMLDEVIAAINPLFLMSKSAGIFLKMPKMLCAFLLWLIQVRRYIRKLAIG